MFVNTILKEKRLSSLKREFSKEDPINICRENSRCHHKVRKQILLGETKDTTPPCKPTSDGSVAISPPLCHSYGESVAINVQQYKKPEG